MFEFSDYELNVFLAEVEEKLETLSENILELEKAKDDSEAIKEMFRAAHTIKGSSAIMGFEKMTNLTHEMETVLDKVRNNELAVDTNVVNVLFECIDALKILQQEIISKNDQFSTQEILDKLKNIDGCNTKESCTRADGNIKNSCSINSLNDIETAIVEEAKAKGFLPLSISVTLDSQCQMKGVRAYLVFHNLQDFGEVIKTEPSIEEIQDGEFETSFNVLILSNADSKELQASIATIAEISKVEITEVSPLTKEKEMDVESITPSPATSKEVMPEVVLQTQAKNPEQEKKIPQTVRVNVDKLDKLMNLVGELVIDRGRLSQVTADVGARIGSDEALENLKEITSHLAQVTNELQDEIMKARMLPVDYIFNRFPRMVRDIAQKLEKEIEFNISGGETELDRTVIEAIGDPLVHLIRNAVDHGIEKPEERNISGKSTKGRVSVSACYQENHVLITVEDDGRGLNPEKLKAKAVEKGLISEEVAKLMNHQEALELIFYPGFSTAAAVNDISGRGVGMDIVRTHIQSINGIIEIDSQLGYGTVFYIKLPLTLAIIQALLAKVEGQVYSFPLANVVEIFKIGVSEIKYIQKQEVVTIRGDILPVYSLAEIFEFSSCSNYRCKKEIFIVVVGIGERRIGIIVDDLLGEQEIVIKTLGAYLGQILGLSGATILGDGRVALIVDIRSVIKIVEARSLKLQVV